MFVWASGRRFSNRIPNSVHMSSLYHIIDQAFPIFRVKHWKTWEGLGTRLAQTRFVQWSSSSYCVCFSSVLYFRLPKLEQRENVKLNSVGNLQILVYKAELYEHQALVWYGSVTLTPSHGPAYSKLQVPKEAIKFIKFGIRRARKEDQKDIEEQLKWSHNHDEGHFLLLTLSNFSIAIHISPPLTVDDTSPEFKDYSMSLL